MHLLCGMRPLTSALLFIVSCYVIALNSIIFNVLYRKYGHYVLWKPNTKVPQHVVEVHNDSETEYKMFSHEAVCTRSLQMVVLVTQSRNTLSNDITKQVALLTRLRTMLRDKHYENIHMFLAVDVNTFMPVHRSLCGNIPRCSLLLTVENNVAEIFEQVSKARPCINDIILITDRANIDPTFLSRVSHTDSSRVTCLLQSEDGQPCPDIAYRIPRAFFSRHRTREIDITSTAVIEGISAPSHAVMSII